MARWGGMGALGAAILVLALSAPQADSQTVVKVGVINTYSGPEAQTGDQMDKGIKL